MEGKTIQTTEENTNKYLCGTKLGKDFLNKILTLLIPEENQDFFVSKDYINRVKRQTTEYT